MSEAVPAAVVDRLDGLGFWQATLNSLGDSLAVLDHRGEIVAVNSSWTRFADASGGSGVGVGANYLDVCDRAAKEDASAGLVAGALRELLAGTREEFVHVYRCHAPGSERWFSMRIAPFEGAGPRPLVVSHHEVTERHEAKLLSRDLVELLDAVGAAIVAIDFDSVITHWSRGAEELHGWSGTEAVGQPIAMISGAGSDIDPEMIATTLAQGRWDGNIDLFRRDGSMFQAYLRTRLLSDIEDRPRGIVGVWVDTTASVPMRHQLRAARDFLEAVMQTMPDGLIVVDGGGRITLVNAVAEEMLGWPAEELLGETKHQKIHRLRGDGTSTSAFQCPICIAVETGASIRIEDDVFQRRDGSFMPVSYAVAPLTTDAGAAGSVIVFGDITETRSRELKLRRELETLSWVGRIRDALDEDRFVLYAQPIIEIATGKALQHELLVRIRGHDGEIIAPGVFLPVAEAHGLIQAIDQRVLELAMPYAAAGHRIGINVSASSISDPGTVRLVRRQLQEHHVDPRLVVFEITETALIQNEAIAQAFVENVRDLNCGVALDDFGTGFGSFRYLKRLRVNCLKVDQEFVQDLDGDASQVNRHVIESIVTLARGMGQLTIGEGVETSSALEVLRELGVDYAQGYLFARPAPADAVFNAVEQEQQGHA
jgi:PAS domain S-box-containing protein